MATEVFIDTSGFYAQLVLGDDAHVRARDFMKTAAKRRRRFVTTDYVLDETATLLRARGHGQVCSSFFDAIFASQVCRIEWMNAERFAQVVASFLKNQDKGWSFTDCFSFCLMRELGITDALTKDAHFGQAGLVAALV